MQIPPVMLLKKVVKGKAKADFFGAAKIQNFRESIWHI